MLTKPSDRKHIFRFATILFLSALSGWLMIHADEAKNGQQLQFMPFIARSGTPSPEDLIIIEPPLLISTPPIVAYQPVQFQTTIRNIGDQDSREVIFVDIFIDPGIPISADTITIPLALSDGFTAISGLPKHTSRTITITSQTGFTNTPENHLVYSMVDSLGQSNEARENNNISTPWELIGIIPDVTPTPTPGPMDGIFLAGIIRLRFINWEPVQRARVFALNESSLWLVKTQTTANGFYQLPGIGFGTFTLTACYELNEQSYTGTRTGITDSDPLANIYLFPGNCPY